MRIRYLLLSFLFVLTVFGASAQENYFNEASQLAAIEKSPGFKKSVLPLAKDGIKVDSMGVIQFSTQLLGLIQQIRTKIDSLPTPKPNNIPKDPYNPGASGPAVTDDDFPSAMADDQITMEIKAVLFLTLDSVGADYLHVTGIPQQFSYLTSIATTINALGQAGFLSINPAAAVQSVIGTSNVLPSRFAFSESNLIYGIADFFIKQAKAELAQVYLTQWYKNLENDEITKGLLPQTLNVFQAFLQDNSVSLAKYGAKWKAAFQQDLRGIPVAIQDSTLSTAILIKVGVPSSDLSEVLPVVTGGDYIVYNLYLKKHILAVLSDLACNYKKDLGNSNLPVFKRLVLISDLFGSIVCPPDDNNSYTPVKLSDLQKMDAAAWTLFLRHVWSSNIAVIHAVLPPIPGTTLNQALAGQLAGQIQQTLSTINAFRNLTTSNNANAGASLQLTADDAQKIFDVSFQLVDNAASYIGIFNSQSSLLVTYNSKIKPYLSGLSEIGNGMAAKDYGQVLDGFIGILSKAGTSKSTLDNLQRFGSFMVNILDAKKPDDVTAALEELIPQNQYELKNVKKLTISIAGYPGITPGYEFLSKYQTTSTGAIDYSKPKKLLGNFSLAPYLPIGIDLNFGRKDSSSFSVFLQLVDLGAVLDYRLTADTSVTNNPNIQFKQLLSPGLAILYRLKTSPVCLGIAGNYTPSLRTVNQGGVVYQPNALRVNVFASVDVTAAILSISRKNAGDAQAAPPSKPAKKRKKILGIF